MIVKLLTEHHLEFLSLKGGCRGSSKSTHVKMRYCWKSRVMAQMSLIIKKKENHEKSLCLPDVQLLKARSINFIKLLQS